MYNAALLFVVISNADIPESVRIPKMTYELLRTSDRPGTLPVFIRIFTQGAARPQKSHPSQEDTMADTYLNSLLGENEKILLTARQHWLVLIGEIASEVLLSIAIIVLCAGLSIFFVPALLGLLVLVAPAVSLTRDVLLWSNRKYIITSRRVIQLSGVISKNVADSSLEKVNDVKLVQSFFGRLLGYGDIEILTASELGVNKILRIADPIRYKIAMVNAKAQLESGEGIKAAGSDVPALLSQLDGLRQKGVISEQEFQEKKAKLMAKL
jgi:hypothetical protein